MAAYVCDFCSQPLVTLEGTGSDHAVPGGHYVCRACDLWYEADATGWLREVDPPQ